MKRALVLQAIVVGAVAVGAVAVGVAGCSSPAPLAPDGATGHQDAGPGRADGDWIKPDTFHSDGPGPMANVYKVSPVEDNKKTSQVLLKELTSADGTLAGNYATVWNCLNELGGPKMNLNLGALTVTGSICKVAQKARRGPDGSYLQIVPPALDTDGADAFAEIMMYHHVTTIGSHYKNDFGLGHVEKSLRAMVNLQGYADLFSNWVGIPNAAFFPKQTADALKALLGVDLMNGEEAIMFGYNNLVPGMPQVDFAYDASVIYHEYTHFTIGPQRLWQPNADQYGIDPTPFALNEALADYMAASYLNKSKLGAYALGDLSRDLVRSFKCPDHIVGEEHHDGEIASGALWAARAEVGEKIFDPMLWKTILTFTASTGFEQAATAIVAAVKQNAPGKEQAVQQIFTDRGMIGCVRLIDHKDFELDPLFSPQKPKVAGSGEAPASFPDGVPGALQYRVALADTTKEVTVEYSAQGAGLLGMPVGGGPAELWVALRKGGPITYQYASGKGSSNAQKMLKGAVTGATQKLVLTGTCISKGDLIFQFLNRSVGEVVLTKVKVTQSSTVTQTTPNFDGC